MNRYIAEPKYNPFCDICDYSIFLSTLTIDLTKRVFDLRVVECVMFRSGKIKNNMTLIG